MAVVRDLHYLGVRATLLLLGALLIAFGAASSARADDPSDLMYDPTTVNVIDLTLSPENEEALENEPEEYVEGTFSMSTTDGTPAGEQPPAESPRPVEIRLKGSASFKPLSGKAAFKLKFAKANAFLGLRKMTLNNMVEDRSLIHETLAYHVFRSAGVPASRTGFAYVRVNGVDYGIYMNVESLDKVALEKRFGAFDEDAQHLYEAEHDVEVIPEKLAEFEVDEGDDVEISDLEALIAAVNGNGPDWSDQVAATADLAEMTEMWAIEKYVGQGDGYAGREGDSQPNNYYLYSDLTGRFQMLPWGTDETWEERLDFDGPAGVMFNRCLADMSCADLYRQQLVALRASLPSLELTARAEAAADLLTPWKEIDPRLEHPEEFESSVAETLAFIAERPGELDAFLGHELLIVDPSDQTSGEQSTVSGAGQGGSGAPPLKINSLRFLGSLVIVNVDAPGSGVVFKRVTGRTKRGWGAACTDQVPAARAGHLTLRCRLSAGFRRKLKSGPLLLKIWIGFQPNAGAPSSASRLATAPRLSKR